MTQAFVLGGVRTPVGRYGGSLSHVRLDDLLGRTMVWACERVGVPLERIEDISAGCVNPAHEGMGDVARWAALAAGFPDSVPAITVNRFCASSLSSAISIAHAIRCDELSVGLAAGVESMSRSGWALMKGEAPFMPRGPVLMLDTMWAGAGGPPNPVLLARNAYIDMMQTAQNVADRYELTRAEIDAFALRSHLHAAAARDSGRLAKEIHPVEVPATRRQAGSLFEHDESIRADTTAEKLAALPAQPNTTQMTAGNSSPLNDGASAVVLASEDAARELGVEPLARVVASATHALDPQVMGIAPAFAIPKALERAGLAPEDVDVWEVHEAYASVAVAILRELPRQLNGFEVPDERLNPNGGAVAIGHPFGSSGTRYVLTLATELRERGARYGVLGVCVGSGQGVALVLENAAHA
ncbi:MAG TPA: thiolase family protein [Solirubrobacteraceae bacterium]|jgi:acetyl-CoA acetyltransferase family protein|nr:thiolase family protein [Solirubrobacteraceae bacterium]